MLGAPVADADADKHAPAGELVEEQGVGGWTNVIRGKVDVVMGRRRNGQGNKTIRKQDYRAEHRGGRNGFTPLLSPRLRASARENSRQDCFPVLIFPCPYFSNRHRMAPPARIAPKPPRGQTPAARSKEIRQSCQA